MAKYLTDTDRNITSNIDNGLTKMFDNRVNAKEFSDKRKTYVFDIFKQEKNKRKIWYAYGVPLN